VKGIAINFKSEGCEFDFTKAVEDKYALVQGAIVNIVTDAGSCPLQPDRGTSLFIEAASGAVVDLNSAAHVSAAAAIETLFTVRAYDAEGQADRIENIQLPPVSFDGSALVIDSLFTFNDDTTIGVLTTI